jgi:microcystin-dependent protein
MNNRIHQLLAVLFLTLAKLPAQDSSPKLINYQGRLAQPNGQPLADSTYMLRFTIHSAKDAAQAGEALIWGSDYAVDVVNGQFNVVLGAPGGTAVAETAVNEIGFAFTSPERFLQIEILNQAGTSQSPPQIILPRQQFLSSPYALNGVPTGVLIPWVGAGNTTVPFPEGWLAADGRTIGKVGSGAQFEGEISRSLFRMLWNSLPVSHQTLLNSNGSPVLPANRGLSADADFDLGRRIAVPDLRGRTAVGTGKGSGMPTTRTLGELVGAETTQLNVSNLPPHQHQIIGYTGSRPNGITALGQNVDEPSHFDVDANHSHTSSISTDKDDGGSSDGAFAMGDGSPGDGRGNPSLGIGGGAHRHRIDFLSRSNDAAPPGGTMLAVPFSVIQPSLVLTYLIRL